MSESFFENTIKYCQTIIDQGDDYYDVHQEDIRIGNDHYQLISDHLAARASVKARSAYYLPELHPRQYSRAANLIAPFIGADPPMMLKSKQNIPELEENVARLEDLVTTWFSKGKFWQQWFRAFLGAEIYPYQPVYIGWKDDWGVTPFINEEEELDYDDVIIYSGGKIVPIPIENYRGDFSARSAEEMKFHALIQDVSVEYIRQRGKDGTYPEYNNAEESRLSADSKWASGRSDDRVLPGHEPYNPSSQIELIELYLKVYDPQFEREVWYKVIFAGDVLLEKKLWPYYDLGAPFQILNSKILPGEVTGFPTTQLGASSQNMINELWNQRIEAAEHSIFPPILYDGEITSDPVWEPMALWSVEKPESFRPLVTPNMSRDHMADVQFLEERLQQTTGSYDTLQPLGGNSEQTLGEYEGKQQNANVILNPTLLAYADAVVESVEMMLVMARERMPDSIKFKLFGPDPALSKLTLQDLAMDIAMDVPKVRALSSRTAEVQKWNAIYNVLSTNPLVMNDPQKLHALVSRYLEALEVKNIEEIIGSKEEMVNLLQTNQLQGVV